MKTPFLKLTYFIAPLIVFLSCGTYVDTGRNEDPNNWPGAADTELNGDGPQNNPGGNPNSPGSNQPNVKNCFSQRGDTLSDSLQNICDQAIKPVPQLSKMYEYICEKKQFSNILNSKSCGWDGTPGQEASSFYRYEIEAESTGQNFQEVHATIVRAPVSAQRFMGVIALAFENYDQFKSKSFVWVRGTKTHANLNQGTLPTGVQYSFKAQTESYPFGYNGKIQLYQIDPTTWIQLNYATDSFERILQFEQATLYSSLSDESVLVFKLEHKTIESTGLYKRVKKTAYDAAIDFMTDTHKNVTNGVPL